MSTKQYTSYNEYENELIEKARKEAQEKWREIEQQQKLTTLYKDFGFKSNAEFIKALQKASGVAKIKESGAKRVRITPEIAAKVKELKASGKSAGEIAKTLGISTPSVYKITKG